VLASAKVSFLPNTRSRRLPISLSEDRVTSTFLSSWSRMFFGGLADARLMQIVVELVDIQVKFSFQGAASFTGDFCFDHLMHLLSRNKKSRSLVLKRFLQRPAMYATGYRPYARKRLTSFCEKGLADFFHWPSHSVLFCCCEGSLPAGKPKRHFFIYVFDFSNPGF